MSSTEAETCKRVHAFFKQKWQASTMKVPDPWVDGCISWYRNSHQNANNQELMEFVLNQWLLVDFAQLNLMSLPVNLKKTNLVNLTENYVLQVTHSQISIKCDTCNTYDSAFSSSIPTLAGVCPQYWTVCLLPAPQDHSGTGEQQ